MFELPDPAHRFVNTTPPHNKFYELKLTELSPGEYVLSCRWGRIGATGVLHNQRFRSRSAAHNSLRGKIREKIRNGYRDVTSEYTLRESNDSALLYGQPAKTAVQSAPKAQASPVRSVGRNIVRD